MQAKTGALPQLEQLCFSLGWKCAPVSCMVTVKQVQGSQRCQPCMWERVQPAALDAQLGICYKTPQLHKDKISMEDKREPQHIPGGGLLEPLPGICHLLPVSFSSPPLAVGRGCEVAASCFAQDQLCFFTHIFLQLRVSGRDVLMITGQAAASPQLPLLLTSRGCSRALEGHLREAEAGKAAWEEATVPCRSNI